MLGWAFDSSLFLSCLGDAHARTRARTYTHTKLCWFSFPPYKGGGNWKKSNKLKKKLQKKKGEEEEKWAVAPKPAWSPISEFSQSLRLPCVCVCALGIGTCLFSISLRAFSSWALALPLLPSCRKPPFPFKAFRHNERIFPCSLWKPGYVRESCSLGGPF